MKLLKDKNPSQCSTHVKERMDQRKNILHSIVAKASLPLDYPLKKKNKTISPQARNQWQKNAVGTWRKLDNIKEVDSPPKQSPSSKSHKTDGAKPSYSVPSLLCSNSMPLETLPTVLVESAFAKVQSMHERELEETSLRDIVRITWPQYEDLKSPVRSSFLALPNKNTTGSPSSLRAKSPMSEIKKIFKGRNLFPRVKKISEYDQDFF